MRHSIAEPTVSTDFLRNLTPEGIERATRVSRHLQGLQERPSAVIHSPLVRSRQTAEIVSKGLEGVPLIELEEVIRADEGLLRMLAAGQWKAPLVVGHNPGISALASQLATERGPLHFQPASLAVFGLDGLPPKAAVLRHWMPTPPDGLAP